MSSRLKDCGSRGSARGAELLQLSSFEALGLNENVNKFDFVDFCGGLNLQPEWPEPLLCLNKKNLPLQRVTTLRG